MINIDIPGFGQRKISRVISDYSGTLTFAGLLGQDVRDRLLRLTEMLEVHILTSDTYGTAQRELGNLPVTLQLLHGTEHDRQKRAYVLGLDPQHVAAFGNGNNDRLMLQTVREANGLAIVVDNGEGSAVESVLAANLVIHGAVNALDLLLDINRSKATLRY